jgi:hypothetical protein
MRQRGFAPDACAARRRLGFLAYLWGNMIELAEVLPLGLAIVEMLLDRGQPMAATARAGSARHTIRSAPR